jgi:[lysine-biosynthesis-protein LysW]--L-2-aminoadipate ligase
LRYWARESPEQDLMPSIALVYDRMTPDEGELFLTAKERNVNLIPLFLKSPSSEAFSSNLTEFQVAINRCESRWRAMQAASILESFGKQVINPSGVESLCGSKIETAKIWLRNGLDVPKWVFIPFPKNPDSSWKERVLSQIEEGLSYPLVLKPTHGSWGRGVLKIDSKEELWAAIQEPRASSINPDGFFVQEYVPKPGFDLRILCYKKPFHTPKYLCCIARVTRSRSEFRTNTHLGGLPLGIDLHRFPTLVREAEEASGLLQESKDASIIALDAMPYTAQEKDEALILSLVQNCIPRFEPVRRIVTENRTRRYADWKKDLEEAFRAYKASEEYKDLKGAIEAILSRARIKWHEANSRFDFAINTRNATGINPAYTYLDLAEESDGST